MAEHSHSDQKINRIYLGEGKAEKPHPERTKADTLYHKKMQEVFDVVLPEAIAEKQDAVEAQGDIAQATADLLLSKKNAWEKYKEHGNLKQLIHDQDVEWRGRELPHKLDRMLVFTALGGASALIDYGSDALGTKIISRNRLFSEKFSWAPKIDMDAADTHGNRKAIKAGWEMLSDKLIGSFANVSVREATNRKDVGFVSPLSESFANVGNVVLSFAFDEDKTHIQRLISSVVNPATIESGIRALAAVPLLGAGVENAYIAANKALLKDDGLFSFGINLAATMVAAKESQMKRVKDIKKVIPSTA